MVIPSTIKIFMRLAFFAPIAFRIAISFFFSMTVMMRELIMLKLATKIIRARIINMAIFSSLRAEKRFLFISIHVLAKKLVADPRRVMISFRMLSAW